MTLTDRVARDEERRWNKLAVTMETFHNYFKREFSQLYEVYDNARQGLIKIYSQKGKLADGSFANKGMSLQMYLRAAENLKKHLEGHHTIEERFIFPELAKKMPSFAEDEQHRKSHEGIHDGLVRLSTLIREFREEPSTYSPQRMRECFDSFKDVLMRHLDEEVEDLRGENMKKYWTLEELDKIPM
ncbi:hypothetical protein ACEPAG_7649 [Sanghuangporus baumii]